MMESTVKRGFKPRRAFVASVGVGALAVSILATSSFDAVATAQTNSPGPLAEGDVLYMVLTDRFFDGDSSNNDFGDNNYDPNNLKMYNGGDWAGLESKLDYIEDLGMTGIWMSPVSEQEPLDRVGEESSYHGYFTHDYAAPNPHFGTKAELQSLLNSANASDLKVVLDAVPNHTADYLSGTSSTYSPPNYKPASPLDNPNFFHRQGDCFDWMPQAQQETCDLGGLDDLDQSNQTVSDFLIDTYSDWVDMGFSGIRVDAAKHISKDWLEQFEAGVGVPTFGEIFVNDVDFVASYQDYQWSALDFPFFFTVREVFAADGDMRNLGDLFAQDHKYVNANRLVTFIDNHDRARFLTWADDNYQRLRSSLTFMLSARGIPVIYYGSEQADDGNGNPYENPIANTDNRKPMESFDQSSTMYLHIQRLNELKENYSALRVGTQREMWKDQEVYAFSRRDDATADETITVANGRFENQTRTIPLRAESSIAVGATLTNLMDTSEAVSVVAGGPTGKQFTVTLGEHQTAIFAPGTPVSTYSPPARNITKIRVHYDVGLNNNIAIRGDSYPLDWDYGRAARNVGPDVWEFEFERIPNGETFEFKPLINDTTWSTGGNYTGTGGSTIDIYPNF